MRTLFYNGDDNRAVRKSVSVLGSEEVQVWLAKVPVPERDWTEFTSLLNDDELARAARFRVVASYREFVFARALLRQLLGTCLNVDPRVLKFAYTQHGKPFIESHPLHFNVSHSHSLVAIAMTRACEVGLDIERIEQSIDCLSMGERIFSAQTMSKLRALPEIQQQEAFFNGWTRKEAYLKAVGIGLIDELASIEVTIESETKPEIISSPPALGYSGDWTIHSIPLPANFTGAVVVKNSNSETGPKVFVHGETSQSLYT